MFTQFDPLLDPIVCGLSDEVNTEHTHHGVYPAQDEEQIWNPIEDVGVNKVALIWTALGNLKNKILKSS